MYFPRKLCRFEIPLVEIEHRTYTINFPIEMLRVLCGHISDLVLFKNSVELALGMKPACWARIYSVTLISSLLFWRKQCYRWHRKRWQWTALENYHITRTQTPFSMNEASDFCAFLISISLSVSSIFRFWFWFEWQSSDDFCSLQMAFAAHPYFMSRIKSKASTMNEESGK